MKTIILSLFLLLSSVHCEEYVYAVKSGLLSHSTGPVSSGKEDGVDINIELLFKKKFLKAYPSIGADINLNSNTSFVYSGLTWEGKFFKHVLIGAFLGLSIHNGDLSGGSSDKRQLGTRLLFREAIDIGFFINKNTSVSFMYDHYSNAGIDGNYNEGNDNMGLRLSYYY